MPRDTHLIWIDLEMTGLDPLSDRILEIATLITDAELNSLAVGPELVLHRPQEVLDGMDDWNQNQHGGSGLIEAVLRSECTDAEAERQTLEFLQQHVDAGVSPMCGNSICQDRRFLARWMPKLEAFFHYRNLDVSTLKELAKRWAPPVAEAVQKGTTHRALEDIIDSIEELKFYRQSFIGGSNPQD